ncbi:MAG: anaerobic ribonucleoside-triphosphate reductase activating protein [Lachnospiraceae bacterium]|nr:anaerobic ribonucleoside-triphosphate reductase activating protein [Lachnospiraceae bacterium]
MQIFGVQKTTLLDYPGKVAATVFTPGCNFRCPYCYNMELAKADVNMGYISENEVLSFLEHRTGILDGICISGGEPTLQKDLEDFLKKVKKLGFSIKLDTNGTSPETIEKLINNGLLDYTAMDIKSSLAGYTKVCGVSQINDEAIKRSISVLKNSPIPFEFRTTVIKEYHNREVFDEIGKLISGAKDYYLQPFTDSENVTDHSLSSYTKEELLEFVKQLEKYNIKTSLRGI